MFFENSVHSSKSAFAELQPIPSIFDGNGQITLEVEILKITTESLILAQDERWRRA